MQACPVVFSWGFHRQAVTGLQRTVVPPTKQSFSVLANQNHALTTSKTWKFFASTSVSVSVAVSMSLPIHGGSLSDRDSSSIPPSDVQRSISPSPVSKARTIIDILLIGKLTWML